ncbi:MAG TPA: substrate-binding domain-containing protein [Pseudonocardiaceae bacterium]|nr:substrate-binding domain-containing protein [Pseudonocardiaceae bacterium]
MSRHRSDKWTMRRQARSPLGLRRIARWPIVVLGLVVLLILGGVAWMWVGGVLKARTEAQAHACDEGPMAVQVAAAPQIAVATRNAAQTYNAQQVVVADHCVQIQVSAVGPAQVLAGLTGSWDATKDGPKPQAWIADSSLWTNQLVTQHGALVADVVQSVASSPIVLAMPTDAAKAVSATAPLSWSGLPNLLASDSGWASLGEPSWGAFTLDLPNPATNPASELALEAMVDPGNTPLTADVLASAPVAGAITTVATKQPATLPSDTLTALIALAKSPGVQGAPYSAVPVPEVALYERNLGTDGVAKPENVLDEVRLTGNGPNLDFPYVPLAGDWVNSAQGQAAQMFRAFLRGPAEQRQLAKAGFRTTSGVTRPVPSPGLDWGTVHPAPLPTDPDTAQRLVTAWTGAQAP